MYKIILVAFVLMLSVLPAYGTDEFDTEKMITDLEQKIKLSQEKLEKLKPALDEKSTELKKSIHESIDKGFAELEKLSKNFETLSKDAEKKVQDVLTSEEMQQLQDYLKNIDKEAIQRVNETIIDEVSALLELTEEQVVKLKPMLDDSFNQLADLLNDVSRKGTESLGEFKTRYDEWAKDLQKKLKGALNNKQLDTLEKHNEELKVKIEENVYAI
ncbi:hypothetical protein [Desulfosediminicola flagellatus]|uniref:hypothetical protein n=1 Tax=Desulfosediminicola flagellatus TaxID=2569541 RepID=UPI0010ADA3AE|nr:hypothetical protein [Desulfosediminicola flagellatus]